MRAELAETLLKLEHAEVKRFRSLAWRHFHAAEVLRQQLGPTSRSDLATEAIYLGGYGAECILKAMLLSRHRAKKHREMVDSDFPRRLGHDLEFIKECLEKGKKGIRFDVQVASSFARIRRTWTSTLRYSPKLFTSRDCETFLSNVEVLLNWAEGGATK